MCEIMVIGLQYELHSMVKCVTPSDREEDEKKLEEAQIEWVVYKGRHE
jgi:hypothetical protein